MPSVEMILYCHNFQRRMAWMLSSICQQKGIVPELIINIASMPNNGNPTTEDLVDFYKDKLQIKHIIFDESERDIFAYQQLVRERQIHSSKADWIYQPDSDHILTTNFFNYFSESLEIHRNCNCCIGSGGRWVTDVEETNKIMTEKWSDLYIDNAYDKAIQIKMLDIKKQRVGSHIAYRRQVFIDKGKNRYTHLMHDNNLFKKGMGSHSDKVFRKNIGGLIGVHWPKYVHLNHVRDKEIGYHSEEQR